MTIDKSKLIELLTKKTGLEEKQVEEQLSILILRVQQAAEQGKDFQIQGFGTFSLQGDALHFEPSEVLETEINHKYAGMKPIELIGAFKDIPSTEEEESDFSIPEDSPGQKRSIEDILGISKSRDLPGGTDSTPDPDPVEQTAAPSFDSAAEEEEVEPEVPDLPELDEEAVFGPTAGPKEEEPEEEKDPIGRVLVIGVILLTISVAAWSVYELGLLNFSAGNNSGEVSVASSSVPVQSPGPVGKTSESMEEPADTENTERGSSQQEPDDTRESGADTLQSEGSAPYSEKVNNISENSAVYGLMGTVNSEANDGYTIVVHSLRQRSRAQRQQEKLISEGYRVILTEAIVNDNTYWRVSLGQFKTLSDAQEAGPTLPEPYANNHFIKRIQ